MGLRKALRGKHVYFDTNIFIYLLEGNPSLESCLQELRLAIRDDGLKVSSCDLVFTEILPTLVKKQDRAAIESTTALLGEEGAFTLHPLSRETCIQAAFFRGETGMKTPDAIHVAAALQAGCDIFLTNDKGIRVPESMERMIISDYSESKNA